MPSKRATPPRLDVHSIDFSNREHLVILRELGIMTEVLGDGRVQVSHAMQKAKSPADAEEGWFLMQDIMKLMTQQKKMQGQQLCTCAGDGEDDQPGRHTTGHQGGTPWVWGGTCTGDWGGTEDTHTHTMQLARYDIHRTH